MSIYDDIREAFDSTLSGVSGLPSVFFENTPQQASASTSYVQSRLFFTSRRPAVRGPSPQMRYEGIYRINVCVPKRSGTGTALGLVEIITTAFDGSTDVVGANKTVSIEYTETGTPFEDEPFYCIPVDINWYIYDQ